jgi:hypothetical protein
MLLPHDRVAILMNCALFALAIGEVAIDGSCSNRKVVG